MKVYSYSSGCAPTIYTPGVVALCSAAIARRRRLASDGDSGRLKGRRQVGIYWEQGLRRATACRLAERRLFSLPCRGLRGRACLAECSGEAHHCCVGKIDVMRWLFLSLVFDKAVPISEVSITRLRN